MSDPNKPWERLKEIARFGGVAAVIFEWFALLAFYCAYPQYFGRQYPISYYATLPGTRWIFSVCYLIAAICFWIFAQYHLRRHLATPIKTFAFSMTCFAITALIPYNPNNVISNTMHLSFAALTFSVFIVAIFLMARNEKRPYREISTSAAILSGVLLIMLVTAPKNSHFVFGLESGSWFVCQLWIIWISLRVFRK